MTRLSDMYQGRILCLWVSREMSNTCCLVLLWAFVFAFFSNIMVYSATLAERIKNCAQNNSRGDENLGYVLCVTSTCQAVCGKKTRVTAKEEVKAALHLNILTDLY